MFIFIHTQLISISVLADTLKIPERGIEKPVRMCVCDVYKGQGSNMCVSGRLDAGYLQPNDRLLLVPQGDVVNLKSMCVFVCVCDMVTQKCVVFIYSDSISYVCVCLG